MKNLILCLTLLISACASKDLSLKGEKLSTSTDSAKMEVTAEVVKNLSDEYNIVLQLNFRSKDGKWIRIDQAELDLTSSDNQPYNIIVGNDLLTWAQAKQEELAMDTHNTQMKTAGVAAVGGAAAVAGALTNNDTLTAAGTLAYTGALTYSLYEGIVATKDFVQGARKVPETHLYASFTVPSMTLVKRWVLINAPTGRIGRTAQLKLKTIEGDVINYKINLVN